MFDFCMAEILRTWYLIFFEIFCVFLFFLLINKNNHNNNEKMLFLFNINGGVEHNSIVREPTGGDSFGAIWQSSM